MYKNKTNTKHLTQTLDISPSTWYKAEKQKSEDKRKYNKGRPKTTSSLTIDGETIPDEAVVSALKELREQKFLKNGGGYRKLTQYLKRQYSYNVNKKKVYRLCKENKLLLPRRGKRKRKVVAPIAINRVITSPLQLWELDIKYGYIINEKKFFFLMAIIDVYLRYIVGYHIGLNCFAEDLERTLKLSLENYNLSNIESLVVRMDNGPQMTSNRFSEYIKDQSHLYQELIPVKTPNKNAHIESFYSIVEMECFQPYDFYSYPQAYQTVNDFIAFYQNDRIHSSLNDRSPQECMDLYKAGKLNGVITSLQSRELNSCEQSQGLPV